MSMGADAVHEASVSFDDGGTGDLDAESSKIDLLVEMSSNGDIGGELVNARDVLLRVELDLARVSEKLVNLSVLMMHVATKESDFEGLASAKGLMPVDSVEQALEFDLLSGILDSEGTELDKFMMAMQTDIVEVGELISSNESSGETFMEVKEKLHDSEKSLKQSQDQVSEIKVQSAKFHRTLSCLYGEENRNGDEGSNLIEDGKSSDMNPKINMHSAEQQRHILRMLEKSLAREMDLEKKLTDSRQIEEELKCRLLQTEQEVFFMEEETMDVYERFFGAENTAEVLMGISKELLSRLQIFQFNLNGSTQREAELRSKLEKSMEQLEAKESALQKFNSRSAKLNDFVVAQTDSLKASLTEAEGQLILANSEAFTFREQVSSLEKQLKESEIQLLNAKVSLDGSQEQHSALCSEITEMENVIGDMKEKLSIAESRVANAEAKLKLLTETNIELNDELGRLRGNSEKVDSFEKQLRESDIRLQHAVASAEASQEKQNLLYSTIKDMENVIDDLKSKVSKAESRADSTEDKCIILSESNAELNEELSFLRGRLECLEASLNQAKETKMATAKDIGFRIKVITELVMQLAIERERLHKQISSLALENGALVVKLQQAKKDPFADEILLPKHGVTQISATGSKLDKTKKNTSVGETKVGSPDSKTELKNVRRIDAELLDFKHVLMAVLILLISAAVYVCLSENRW